MVRVSVLVSLPSAIVSIRNLILSMRVDLGVSRMTASYVAPSCVIYRMLELMVVWGNRTTS